jgi:hypothetical protein
MTTRISSYTEDDDDHVTNDILGLFPNIIELAKVLEQVRCMEKNIKYLNTNSLVLLSYVVKRYTPGIFIDDSIDKITKNNIIHNDCSSVKELYGSLKPSIKECIREFKNLLSQFFPVEIIRIIMKRVLE